MALSESVEVFSLMILLLSMGISSIATTSDEISEKLDALVEIEAFNSRSEAAAFFIREGLEARKDIVEKVMPTIEKIKDLRTQAKQSLGIQEKAAEKASKE